MKVAVVHDYLTQTGGAERVVLALANVFPEAPIITSLYSPSSTFASFEHRRIETMPLQRFIPPKHFRAAAPLFGPSFRALDLSAYDKVVVSTSGFAHHIRHPDAYVFCHSPPHFIYDLDNYLNKGLKQRAARLIQPALRAPDQRAARRHANYAANSQQTAGNIARVYNREARVIYPPFATAHLPDRLTPLPSVKRVLAVGRLLPYKRFDTVIRAAERAGLPLTIVGTGPDEARLRQLAGNTVRFAGRLGDERMAEAFTEHTVAVMPGIEDFGFAPLEANYAGRPIVGIAQGGAVETIRSGVNGLLVEDHDVDNWAKALLDAVAMPWDPDALRAGTEPFQFDAFRRNICEWMSE